PCASTRIQLAIPAPVRPTNINAPRPQCFAPSRPWNATCGESGMTVFLFLIVLAIALAFAPGVGILAVVPAVLAVLYFPWLILTMRSGRTPGSALRRRRARL